VLTSLLDLIWSCEEALGMIATLFCKLQRSKTWKGTNLSHCPKKSKDTYLCRRLAQLACHFLYKWYAESISFGKRTISLRYDALFSTTCYYFLGLLQGIVFKLLQLRKASETMQSTNQPGLCAVLWYNPL